MSDRPSDEELARRAQGGCRASFEELTRRFQVPLLHFLSRWADREDAEDLVQDTLVRAYENLDRYRPAWRFATWLFTIARRLSMNLKRRRRPRADGEAMAAVEDRSPGPGVQAAANEGRERLWSAAAEVLTEPQMTATWLYYVEEMPIKEIARVVGCSQVAAKISLFRARKRLMPVLRPWQPGGAHEAVDPPGKPASCRANVE
jgi:RNA polymerase sigma-70 factor (ECF subfamily)